MFSDRFLAAPGGWENGWREDSVRRLQMTEVFSGMPAFLYRDLCRLPGASDD
jgi:hypothetical protein